LPPFLLNTIGSRNDFSGVDKTGKIWGLRYGDFVVPLVKAVQELSQQNDEKDNKIAELENRLANVEKLTAQYVSQQPQHVELGIAAKLEQNIPNPFSNTTTIGYYLPVDKANAYINFYASNGAFLKSVKLSGSGNGTINVKANELPSGAYRYSLIIDGKVAETKQMVQAK
jgi:trimeric autotransporter adhesin